MPLLSYCRQAGLKGTILLSEEGVNLYLTGKPEKIEAFKSELTHRFEFPPLPFNETQCSQHAYSRLKVKIKPEIVTMGVDGVDPIDQPANALSPVEFKQWLDEQRDLTILDTRNHYEVGLGKFEGAIDLHVNNFKEFAQKAKELPEQLKDKPLVMYCTGGIRCEKSSRHFVHQLGFKHVYQLQGGILNYFQQCGRAHWSGECFVFDERVSLDDDLKETGTPLAQVQPESVKSKARR